MEFQMVRVTEDRFDGATIDGIYQLGALAQPPAQERVIQKGPSFIDALNRILVGSGADAQAFDLGKNEPHPVALLLAVSQLIANLGIDGALRVDETLQIVGIEGSCHKGR